MRFRSILGALVLSLGIAGTSSLGAQQYTFVRGDSNADGSVNLPDVVFLLNYLFVPGANVPVCFDACDVNDNGSLNLLDAVVQLSALFTMGPPPPAPFPDCGEDPTPDNLTCDGPVPACPEVNEPPTIVSTPPVLGTETQLYLYDVDATDPNLSDVLSYSIVNGPAGASIDVSSGVLTWTPDALQTGSQDFTVRVTDNGFGPLFDEQTFTVVVDDINQAPAITSLPPQNGTEGQLYTYTVVAIDPDPTDTVTYTLPQAPAGASIDPSTGLISWTPSPSQTGPQSFTARATDNGTPVLFDEQAFVVTIADVNNPPVITSAPSRDAVETQLYTYDIDATDPDPTDVVTYSLVSGPAGVTVDATTGVLSWTPQAGQTGPQDFVVRATDNGAGTLFADQSFIVQVQDVNQAPQITSAPILTATETARYTYDVEANDPDPTDSILYSLVTAPLGATIDSGTGLIQWTPDATQTGTQSFVVRAADNGTPSLFVDQAFDVSVTDINQMPVISSLAPTTATENQPFVYSVVASDPDPGDTLTFSLPLAPSGAVVDPITGEITWTPGRNQTGPQNFIVRATDDGAGNLFAEQGFTLDVIDVNQAPVITSTPIGTATEASPYSYDVDATDPDPTDMLTFSLTTAPTGAAIDPGTGVITWTPASTQTGPQSFVVRATDDGVGPLFTEQVFDVIVTDINQPPTITSAPLPTAAENSLYAYDVEASDPDPTDTLTYTLETAPAGATIDASTGLISWTPSATQVAAQSFVVRATDDGVGPLFVEQSFTVNVTDINQPPMITSAPVTTAIEAQLYTYDVEASDPDPTDLLTFSLQSAPAGATIDPSTGVISWTPTADQGGDQTFNVRVTDNGAVPLLDEQSFAVSVTDVNQAPVIVSVAVTSATENSLYTYDVEAVDVDPSDTLTYSLPNAPTGATIDPATGLVEWLPSALQTGLQAFTVRVEDDGVGTLAAEQVFTVDVVDVNQPPIIVSTPVTTGTETALYTYDVEATDPDPADLITYALTLAPAGATIDPATGLIEWTPDADRTGAQSFTVRATDDGNGNLFVEQSFVVNVVDINQGPSFTSSPQLTATETGLYTYDADATDPDPSDTLVFSLPTAPAGATIDPATGLVQWTPTALQTGPQSFTVRCDDDGTPSAFAEQAFVVVVTDVNQPPVITSTAITTATELDLYEYDVEATDVDPSDTLSYSLTQAPPGATVDPVTGVISWIPDATQTGPQGFTVRATDDGVGSLFVEQAFTVIVTDINQAPTITTLPPTTATELTLYTYDAAAVDPDPTDTLTFTLVAAPAGASIDATTGLITWTPSATQTGAQPFTLRVTDNGAPALDGEQSFVVNVTDINQTPVITSLPPVTATETVAYGYDVEATDPDPTDTLTYSLTTAPIGASIDPMTGAIAWTPDATQTGVNDFVVRVTDDGVGSLFAEQSFQVNVTDINQAPIITSAAPAAGVELDAFVYDVEANDPDPADTLLYSLPTAPAGAGIDSATGVITWTPDATQTGNQDFVVRVADNGSPPLFAEQAFSVLVTDINQPPSFVSTPNASATEIQPYTYSAQAIDPDPSDTLTYSLVTNPVGATVDPTSGLVNWTPSATQTGPQSFTIRATDDGVGNLFVEQSFVVTVTDVNQVPSIVSTPATTGIEAMEYLYDVDATDPDPADQLTYSLTEFPNGAMIDASSGTITWTPSATQTGAQNFTVRATDDGTQSLFTEQSFVVTIVDVNQGPQFTSSPVTTATEVSLYTYDANASDPDPADILTYELAVAPAGAGIDPASGVVTWTPDATQTGNNPFQIRVSDDGTPSLFAVQAFVVSVTDINQSPMIVTSPTLTATETLPYSYDVDATDPDPTDTLTYSLVAAPPGATIDPNSGLLAWTPDATRTGPQAFHVRVTDDGTPSAFVDQAFTVQVADINQPPVITSAPNLNATELSPYTYDVDATDPDPTDNLIYALTTAPLGATIDAASGLIEWTPSALQTGPQLFTVQVDDDGVGVSQALQSFTVSVTDINQAPTIVSVPVVTAAETTLYTYDVDAVDPDPADTLTYSLTSGPDGATIDPATGLITWTPTAMQTAPQSFAVLVTDNGVGNLTAEQLFTVQVTDVNQPPTITTLPPLAATENQPYTYDADAADPDPIDTLTFSLPLGPVGASIDPVTGVLTWTPSATQTGPRDFTIRVTDDGALNLSADQSFTVVVTDVNQTPSFVSAPLLTATETQLYSYTAQATDPDPTDTLSYTLTTAPVGASIDAATGVLTWIPTATQTGPQAITVRVTDNGVGNLFAEQSFLVAVIDVNQPPQITSTPALTATETNLYSYDVEASDADPTDVLTFSLVTAPAGATIDPNTGLIGWTPSATQTGPQNFLVRVADNGVGNLTAEQAFQVNVTDINQNPTFVSAPILSGTETVAYTYDADAVDPDPSDVLTYSLPVAPLGATIDPSTGILSWTPTALQTGLQSFTIRATDSGSPATFAEQSFVVGVQDVNQAPFITTIPVVTATEAAAYQYDVDATDEDPTDVLTFSLTTAPIGATIDPTTGLIQWTPSATQTGAQNFIVRVTDNGTPTLFSEQSYAITVTDVNQSPAIDSAPVLTATENTVYSYDVNATDPDPTDTLTFSLPGSPDFATIDAATGVITWIPTALQTGAQAFTVRATDDGVPALFADQSFTVTVADVNQPPVFTSAPVLTAVENSAYAYDANADDPDPTDTLSFSLFAAPTGATIASATGLISWTPSAEQTGPQLFTVRVTDDGVPSSFADQTFSVVVTDINQPPVITSTPALTATELDPYTYVLGAMDPDPSDTVTYSLVNSPAGATLNAGSGLLQWTPSALQTGPQNFVVRATDNGLGTLFAEQSFTVVVTDINQPPVLTSAPVTTATELIPYTYDVDATDPDPSDTLTYSLDASPLGATIDSASGVVQWTPNAQQTGLQSFTVRVTDDGVGLLAATQSFQVDVTDVNQPPVFTSAPVLTATEIAPYAYDVDADDPDPTDILTFSFVTAPLGATIDPTTGVIAWIPAATQTGPQLFQVRVTDNGVGNLFSNQNFVVTVVDVNQPPAFVSAATTTAVENSQYIYDANAEDPDPSDVLTYSLVTAPTGASIASDTGLITWTPSATQTGAQAFTVRATDNGVGTLFVDQSFTVAVTDINQPPMIVSVPVTSRIENNLYSYDVDATDPDPSDTLIYSLVLAPTGATINPVTGLINWTPSATQTGLNDFVVRATDDGTPQLFGEQSFAVSIADINQPPVFATLPPLTGVETNAYTYDAEALDPDPTDVLTYSLTQAPAGASIDPATGLVQWTPTAVQTGAQPFTVRATDNGDGNLFVEQAYVVTVVDINQPPVITSAAVTTATEISAYSYDVEAADPDPSDTLTFSLTSAPVGAAIDPTTGLITWTPTALQTGPQPFVVRATDDGVGALFSEQAFDVVVLDINQAPSFVTAPVLVATETQPYTYDADGSDPDPTDTLTFSLVVAPAGATVDPTTGVVSWTPDATQTGAQSFTLRVADNGTPSLFADQAFSVDVTDINQAPEFTTVAPTTATENSVYTYAAAAADPDPLDVLTFTFDSSPAGALIDAATGLVTWTPSALQTGPQAFSIRVTDNGVAPLSAIQSFTVNVVDVNQAPVIDSMPILVATENALYNYDVNATDPDPTDVLIYTLELAPAGAAIDAASGLIMWTPDALQPGAHDFIVRATDNGAGNAFAEQSFTVVVANINQTPVITSNAIVNAVENSPYTYDVDATDPDPSDVLTFSLVSAPAGAGIDGATGLITWTPLATQTGLQSFLVRVTDDGVGSLFAEQSFQVDVLDINQSPTIVSVPPTTATETQLFTYDVDATDPDPGDGLVFTLVNAPLGASIDSASGLISWTPTALQGGLQAFLVRVTDDGVGSLSADQGFAVTVIDVNQPPTIDSVPVVTATENSLYTYAVNGTDPDPIDTLTYSLVVAPAGATVDPVTGIITWIPSALQTGAQNITVRATDDGVGPLFTEQSFTVSVIDVNQVPVITSMPLVTGTETALYSYTVVATDPDPTDQLSYSLPVAPTGAAIDALSGAITWTPAATQTGPQAFTVRVTDNGVGSLFSEQSFTVAVTDINQPPSITSLPVVTGTENSAYTYDVDANDPDPGDVLTFTLPTAPSGASINATTGLISWTPSALQTGIQSFLVRVTDNGVGNLSAEQAFTVTVTDINQAPTITTVPITTAVENSLYTYDVDGADPDPGDMLTFQLLVAPAGATIDGTTGVISWTPSAVQTGLQAFTVELADNGVGALTDTQSFNVDVSDINQAPVITSLPITTATEVSLYTYDVDALDPDPTDTLTFSLITNPAGANIDPVTGVISWTPTAVQTGPQGFTVRATDDGTGNLFSQQSFTVNVIDINQAPSIVSVAIETATENSSYTYGVDAIDPDPTDTLTYTLVTAPTGANIDPASGVIDWIPSALQTGAQSFVVRATDDGAGNLFAQQSFTVNVIDINQAPTITSAPNLNAEEVALYVYDVEATDPDPTDSLTFSLPTAPAGATVDASSGLIEWIPTALQVGPQNFTVRVTDDGTGTLFAEQTFQVTVLDVNQAPTIASVPTLVGVETQLYTYDMDGVDPDPGDTLAYSIVSAPLGATMDAGTGALTWIPSALQTGMQSFTLRVTDDGVPVQFADQSFTVNVTDVNQGPTITSSPNTTATEASAYAYDVDATDPDPADTLTFSLLNAPTGAGIDAASGLISWTPSALQTGPQSFTVRVTDDGVGSLFSDQMFVVNVIDINQAPSFLTGPPLLATENSLYTYDANAFDPDPTDLLTFSIESGPAGSNVNASTGLLTWTPSAVQTGLQAFTIRVADNGTPGLFADQTFSVDVTDINQPPVITSAPVTTAVEISLYSYQVVATDPDPTDLLSFTLTTSPTGATIDAMSGLIEWTPSALQTGLQAFTVRVTDNGTGSLFSDQSFTVNVTDINQAPSIVTLPSLSATENSLYTYDADATDPDPTDSLSFSLVTGPAGVTVDATTGLLSWTPSALQTGNQAFTIRVTDNGVGNLTADQSFTVNVIDINQPPQITSVPITVATEESIYTYDVEAGDPDPSDSLTFSLGTAPGGASIDPLSGVITWTPNATQPGANNFVVLVTDDGVGSLTDTQSFVVDVTDINQPPEFTSSPVTTGTEESTYTYSVIAIDPDPADVLTYSILSSPAGATIDGATGVLSWTPSATQTGMQMFTIRATDNGVGNLFADQAFSVDVTDINQPPVFTSIANTLATENSPYTYSATITDPDPTDTHTYSLPARPAGATVNAATGVVTWIPAATQVGPQTFTLRVTDSGVPSLIAEQTFSVDVEDINQAPTIVSAPPTTATEASLYTYDVDATDPDPGDILSFTLVASPVGATINPSTGLIQWTPSASQTGPRSFVVRATDNGVGNLNDEQSFVVNVIDINQQPSITSLPNLSATENSLYTYSASATDPDPGDVLTFSLTTAPAGATINGTTGLLSWTPSATQTGPQGFTVRVTDNGTGTLFADQSFTVNVIDINQAPVITSLPVTSGTEIALYTYDVDATDPDPTDVLTFSLDTAPTGAAINAGTGVITWTPSALQTGSQSFTVRATDNGTGLLFATQSFSVDVTDVNQPPTFTSAPTTSATENSLYTYDSEASDPDPGDTLTYTFGFAPAGALIDPSTGVIVWTPSATQMGAQDFQVVVTDNGVGTLTDTQSFTVNVIDINQAPTITSAPIVVAIENNAYTYDVEASDPDPSDVLTYTLTTSPAGASIDNTTGVISWTPSAIQTGPQSFVVVATDDGVGTLSDSQSFVVNVTDINQAPTITSAPVLAATENALYSYTVIATDPDPADVLTYALQASPAGASIDAATGLIQWTPSALQTGAQNFTVRATDNGVGNLFDQQSFTVNVTDVNQSPSFTTVPPTTATENSPFTYASNATDPDPADTLTYSLPLSPSGASVQPTTGVITWTPSALQTGPQDFVLRVTDNGVPVQFVEQAFTINVIDVNQEPTITTGPITDAIENSAYTYDVDATDPDPSDSLTFSLDVSPSGSAIDMTTGEISWIPSATQTGPQLFTVRVTDDGVGTLSDTQSFTVNVVDINQAPTITTVAPTAATEGQLFSYDVDATDPDPTDTLTYSLVSSPSGASINSNSGLIQWTPSPSQMGIQAFSVRVTDDGTGNLTDEQNFLVSVTDVNNPPTIDSAPVTVATEASLYGYDVDASDIDPGDTLTFSLTAAPTGATINATTGILSWTPNALQTGPQNFTILVEDDGSPQLSATQSFTVNVIDINQTPTITSLPILNAVENSAYTYDVDASDPDPSDTLIYSLSAAPTGATIDPGTGVISWTPDATQPGDHVLTVRATDDGVGNLFSEQTFTVTVDNINQSPVVTSVPVTSATELSLYTYDVEAVDPDPEDTLTFTLQTAPGGASIDATTGVITWTPSALETGLQSFIVRISDDGTPPLFVQHSFAVAVTDINQVPVVTTAPITTATENSAYTYDVDASDPDPTDTLTFTLEVAPGSAGIDAASGVITWTPLATETGLQDFTVRVTDNGAPLLFAEQTFTVNVGDINQAPTIISAPVTTGTEGVAYAYDVDANDPDPTDTLTYSLLVAPSGASIDGTTGLISWTPTFTQAGSHPFTVRATDNGTGSLFDEQSFDVSVSNVNLAPSITSTPVTDAIENDLYTYDVDGTDPDSGDTLTYTLETSPAGSSINATTGVITWTPIESQVGMQSFTARATDTGGLFAEQSWTVDVEPENELPVFSSTAPTEATVAIVYNYDSDATDPEGTAITYSLDVAPAGATINATTGEISWTPLGTQMTSNAFTVRATDALGGFSTQSFSVDAHYRINCGELSSNYTDSFGNVWAADFGFDAGSDFAVTDAISGTPDPTLFQTLRFSFTQATYNLPVPNVTVRVRLLFAEVFHTSTGSRIFDVLLEGATALDDFDIVAAAGSAFEGHIEEFEIDVTDGVLQIQILQDLIDLPILCGIELFEAPFVAPMPPMITSTALTTAVENAIYVYDVDATDPNFGDPLTYSFQTAPAGATIEPDSGVILWIPNGSQVGIKPFTVRVTDGGGLFDEQSFDVDVDMAVASDPPTITSSPVVSGTIGVSYSYDVEATDPESDPLVYSLTTAPAGASINALTGLISWDPTGADIGNHDFTVRVQDPGGAFDEQSFMVDVRYRINCGEPTLTYTDSTGDIWSADFGFDSGGVFSVSDPIAGTADETLFQTLRFSFGTTVYSLPLPSDDYRVRLSFAEIFHPGAGLRIFDVSLEGAIVLNDYDIADPVGAFTATIEEFTATVADGSLEITIAADVLDLPTINAIEVFVAPPAPPTAPSITSVPTLEATEGVLYTYDVDATDPNSGDTITFTLETAPTGATIDSMSGLISWTPGAGQLGLNAFTVRATDSALLFSEQSFDVDVSVPAPPEPPVFTSMPSSSSTVMVQFQYDAEVSDANPGDTATFSLVESPTSATIDATTGVVSWTPTGTDVGYHRFIVRATDTSLLTTDQAFGVETRYRINCGDAASPYVDSLGNTWATDFGFDSGGATSNSGTVAGTADSLLFESLRFTLDPVSTYNLAVASETYLVRLHFAALFFDTVGERVFDIGLEGVTVLDDYDIVAVTGSDFTAQIETFTQPVTDGFATIDLIDGPSREPVLNAIEITVSNNAPTITSSAPTTATVGIAYTYSITVTDTNPNDFTTFSLTTAPAGAAIDPISGEISWTPVAGQEGPNSFTVRVTDGGGLFFDQSFSVTVN